MIQISQIIKIGINLLKNPFTYIVILGLLSFFSIKECKSNKNKSKIMETNFKAVVLDNNAQQVLTKIQLRKYYKTIIDLAKVNGIKAKDIKTINKVHYTYKDSINIKDSVFVQYTYKRDTTSQKIEFIAHKDCYTVTGIGSDITTKITSVKFDDDITTFIYSKYNHHFLFFRWGKELSSKTVSSCSGTTINTQQNIQIQKL